MPNTASSYPSARELGSGRIKSHHALAYRPYWWDAAPGGSDENLKTVPKNCDVAIVGSGFTGFSAALTLARAGRSVSVFERGRAGFGASTRNGGQVGSGNQKFRVKTLIDLRGRRKAEEMLREGTRMLEYIATLIETEKIDCHFRRNGRFRAAVRAEHYEAMAADMRDLKEVAGVESFMVPKAEQTSELGTDAFFGGSVLPNDASLHPGLYHAGLMQRFAEAGGQVVDHTGVTNIEPVAGGFRVRSKRGETLARNVLIASNGYTDALVPELRCRIVPVGSAIIATGEIPEALYSRLLPKNRVYGNTNRVFYYFRGAPDARRILWGGRVGRLSLSKNSPQAYRHLAQDMLRVFPDLGSAPITHAWDGTIGYTYDEIPHLGKTAAGMHYAIGYCGTGVSRATYFGNKIALQMLERAEGRTSFDDLAFPAFPAHAIAQRAVPFVEAWYRLRDTANM
ncbi:FAD-binding oxidoreductase [Hyphomicrobium sp.]|uniref:NAD(P)/FAD-dependent oxidoreductase n=1 Tax=Hyphomicrobium sp. TaxID=82 RepID=UPI000FA6658F|nr:FAD-binding oxidoreductase [Hyphomicrobium sp.]RUP00477.1 MAG: FAD-binding oxidoreductase [Hyphomicrobium sp.]